MSADTHLPAGFAALEPFVEGWALGTTAQRAARRSQSTPEERQAFFTAASPLLDAALDRLDAIGLAGFAPEDQRLMDLMLALAHIALAVEIQGPDEAASAQWRDRMRIDRSTADQSADQGVTA